uniref:Uncharacterized protein n=1 Tax=Rhizophora mucronata TaxID=61149 RepID=A0A2P2LSN3_RHIMU
MRKVDRYVMIKEEEATTKQLISRVDQERNLERISVMEEGRGSEGVALLIRRRLDL